MTTADDDRSPEELLAAMGQIGDLQHAIVALPQFLAEPLMLYLDDLSDEEIASKLNVTNEIVRKRRQIARALLRLQLPG
jgi:DNA-directed RNA polymerase specialized sigma24 family protein